MGERDGGRVYKKDGREGRKFGSRRREEEGARKMGEIG